MRFKSKSIDGFQVFAVSGTNTVSFAITATAAAKSGLLGFAVERTDETEHERYVIPGYKVFASVIPHPDKNTRVSTADHPVQSFVWDDFTAKAGRPYEYAFRPLRGTPKALDRTARPVSIEIRTEEAFSKDEHDVFFNRGVASSQAYEHKFGDTPIAKLPAAKQKDALAWLTRDLEAAILKFIGNAKKGDALHCCFYEFRYLPVLKALAAAKKRGVDLRIIIDAKMNGKKGKKPFPRAENLKTIKAARLPDKSIIKRDANPSNIQHNKFMVLLRGGKKPIETWSGSTNISQGGISGQTNVGHWVRDEKVARAYEAYWQILSKNPGSRKGGDKTANSKKSSAYKKSVEALAALPANPKTIAKGVSLVCSPRSNLDALNLYVALVDGAGFSAGITLAFGINTLFKDKLRKHTDKNGVTFLLLETQDKPSARSKTPFVSVNAKNNVYKAWGSFLKSPVYQWAKETSTRGLGLNTHVAYIHSKFLLRDPLGDDPVVVTGSANFSAASTTGNDENMLVIRGNQRVADIYFTEFNRLFNHYYFRAVVESEASHGFEPDKASLFLDETGKEWIKKYAPGKLRTKRVAIYAAMKGKVVQSK
jgi:phosphatidylserine/phosphatidylglycerophosphate/cardiolipin synthase-like enzyme